MYDHRLSSHESWGPKANSAQFIYRRDKNSTTKNFSRPLDIMINTFGEGKDYSELFKMENGSLLDETQADQIAQDTFKFVSESL